MASLAASPDQSIWSIWRSISTAAIGFARTGFFAAFARFREPAALAGCTPFPLRPRYPAAASSRAAGFCAALESARGVVMSGATAVGSAVARVADDDDPSGAPSHGLGAMAHSDNDGAAAAVPSAGLSVTSDALFFAWTFDT